MKHLTALLLALLAAGSLTACAGAAGSTPASSAAESTATEPAASTAAALPERRWPSFRRISWKRSARALSA